MLLTLRFISSIAYLPFFLQINLFLIVCFNGLLIIISCVLSDVSVFLFCVPIIIINWIFSLLHVCFFFYISSHLGYRCFDIESHRMYISRDVRFHEHGFPFDNSEQIAQVSTQNHTPPPATILPNLTHSPLFIDYDTPPEPASALHSPPTKIPQPPPFPCRSPHASLSHTLLQVRVVD